MYYNVIKKSVCRPCVFLFLGANYKLQNQISTRESAETEATEKIRQLTKEKDELLELAMQRGKIIQVE